MKCGQPDRFEREPEPLADEQVNDAERQRNAGAPDEHLVEQAVERVGVMLDVAVEAPLVEQHAVDDAALLAGAGGLADELAAAARDLVELGAARAGVERGHHGAAEQERARLQLIVQRTDETSELGDGIGKLQLLEEPRRVAGEDAVVAAGGRLQEVQGIRAETGEMREERLADRGSGIVEQITKRLLAGFVEFDRFHATRRKIFCHGGNRKRNNRASEFPCPRITRRDANHVPEFWPQKRHKGIGATKRVSIAPIGARGASGRSR